MDQPVVEGQQGQVEEETLPDRVLGPGGGNLCVGGQAGKAGRGEVGETEDGWKDVSVDDVLLVKVNV